MRGRLGSFFRRSAEVELLPAPLGGTLLAPLDGSRYAHVDTAGNVGRVGQAERLTWQVRTADGWTLPAGTCEQRLDGAAVIETTLGVDNGTIVQRCAVGIAGGIPALAIEFENRSDYAVAIGLAVEAPSASTITSNEHGLLINGEAFALFGSGTRPQQELDDPHAVFALPHTATLKVTVPLDRTPLSLVELGALAVPSPSDINRGWERHLDKGFRIEVGDDDLEAAVRPLQRSLLSLGPGESDCWKWAVAMCESGYASEIDADLEILANESPAHVVFGVGRWAELGGDLTQTERILEPLARSAFTLRRANHQVIVPMGWSVGMLAGAVRAAVAIDQPDVADELAGLTGLDIRKSPLATVADVRADLASASATYAFSEGHHGGMDGHVLRSIRHLVVDEGGDTVDLLASMPAAWRGRPMAAHNVPIAAGNLSYGLRWHGPRPALLWELDRRSEARFEVRVPSISSEWSSLDDVGESLLPDPGWPTG